MCLCFCSFNIQSLFIQLLCFLIHSKNDVDPKIWVPALSMPNADNDAQWKERVLSVKQILRGHAKHDKTHWYKMIHFITAKHIWNFTKSVFPITNTNDHAEMVHCFWNMCARLRKSNALRRNWTHNAVEGRTIVQICALSTNERAMPYCRNRLHYLWNACWLSIFGRKKVYFSSTSIQVIGLHGPIFYQQLLVRLFPLWLVVKLTIANGWHFYGSTTSLGICRRIA